jgi:hypothetical protein
VKDDTYSWIFKTEGRPLTIGLQELISYHLMLHGLRAFVVRDEKKVLFKGSGIYSGED